MNKIKGTYFIKESGILTIMFYKLSTLNQLTNYFPEIKNKNFLSNNYYLKFFVFEDNYLNYKEFARPACFNMIEECISNNLSCNFYENFEKINSIFPELNQDTYNYWKDKLETNPILNPKKTYLYDNCIIN